ncbi:MAG: glycosyltransferase [Lachnospiraceae bacterium]|nr:glycosyltransferase [Lachnospiraceae bacterium]
MQKPFFSIIVVSLNAGERLNNTVESILGQSYEDYEVIIKDGGSTDGSLDFLSKDHCSHSTIEKGTIDDELDQEKKRVKPAEQERIKLITKKDQGIYDAMNQALEEAVGEYYLFLNCGDYFYDLKVLEKTKREVERKQDEAKEKKPSIFYGNLFNRKQHSVITSAPQITDFTLYRNVPCHQVCFYHYSLFLERGYDISYRVRADYEHFLYCVKKKGAIGYAMDHVVASYEGGGFSETKENRKRSSLEHKQITQIYLKKSACIKYRLILWLTLAPLRSKIAESPRLSAGYNKIKSLLYR